MTPPLRLLLWLKWTLTWRGYRRSRAKVFSTILLLVIFLPLSGFAAYGVWALLLSQPGSAQWIARDALSVIFLIWLTTPLLGFQVNESFDLTRLFVYPISPTLIFIGSLLGGLLDRSALLVLPVLGVLLVLFSPNPAAFIANFVLLLLFLLHTLALGQALMLLLIGFLRSRRFRDATIVLFPLIGMAFYLGQRLLVRQIAQGTVSVSYLLNAPAWRAMDWLPPGYTALGLETVSQGRYGMGALAALLLVGAAALAIWVAVTTLKTLFLGDAGPPQPHGQTQARPPGAPAAPNPLLRFLPDQVAAVAQKEWIYFQREPQYKALAVQTIYTLVWLAASIALPSLRHGGGGFQRGDGLLLTVAGVLLLSMLPLLFNIWAGEGAAITVLFGLPTSRRDLILGKNVAHGTLLLGVCAVGLVAAAAFGHGWRALPVAAVGVVLAAPLLLAAGNLVSIRFPHRMLVRGQRWRRGGVASTGDEDGTGCAYSFLYALAYVAACLALLPVLAAVSLPGHWGISPYWYALSLPLAAIYTATLYVILLKQAEMWLLAREPEIVARIVPE